MWRWLIGGVVLVTLVLVATPAPIKTMVMATVTGSPVTAPATGAPRDPEGDFIAAVLGSTEDVWAEAFANGQLARLDTTPESSAATYTPPLLVLFSGAAGSACATIQTKDGPLYCEKDRRIYIDAGFFRRFGENFNAPGDMAQAYIIAHEVAHHIQNELGILARADAVSAADPARAAEQSVRVELQADCLAGVWAGILEQRRTPSGEWVIEPGDLAEAVTGAGAVGDDTAGYTNVEAFTHGTAAQRQHWFLAGYQSRDPSQCDTFSTTAL